MPGLTVPHLVDFGSEDVVGRTLLRPEAWDGLRTATTGPFALAETRQEWESAADRAGDIEARMRILDARLRSADVGSIASYGVGAALPELWLHRLSPERRLTVTDYAPATVARLRGLFGEAEVVHHDLLADAPLEADVHLFHRIDTELSNRQWRRVLRRFADCRVVLVATDVYDARRIRVTVRQLWHRRRWTRAGWARTRGAFEALWRRTHRAEPLDLGDLEAWMLTPRG